MSHQQKLEKITHLKTQLDGNKYFDFSIRNAQAVKAFYNRRLNYYNSL